jgi:hypothetical protein
MVSVRCARRARHVCARAWYGCRLRVCVMELPLRLPARYIYNQKKCGRCSSHVRTWDMAGRTVYACEHCQPLAPATELSEGCALCLSEASPSRVHARMS